MRGVFALHNCQPSHRQVPYYRSPCWMKIWGFHIKLYQVKALFSRKTRKSSIKTAVRKSLTGSGTPAALGRRREAHRKKAHPKTVKTHRSFYGCWKKLTYESKTRAFTQLKYAGMPNVHAVNLHFTSRICFFNMKTFCNRSGVTRRK